MPSDDPHEPLTDHPSGLPPEEEAGNDPPPEDYPDLGMGTAGEEVALAEEVPPELADGGMSAGYPPTRDEDLPPKPGAAIPKPDPAAMSGAPLFSAGSFEPLGPGPAAGEGQPPLQEVEKPAEPPPAEPSDQ